MGLVRKQIRLENLSSLKSESLFTQSGIILMVNASWVGYTKDADEVTYELGHVFLGFLDDSSNRPLGENSSTRITVPYGGSFQYANPLSSKIYAMVQANPDPNWKLVQGSTPLIGEFDAGLTVEAISEDTTKPHSVDVTIDVYLYES